MGMGMICTIGITAAIAVIVIMTVIMVGAMVILAFMLVAMAVAMALLWFRALCFYKRSSNRTCRATRPQPS
jgi:hypothetical protein